ncbi:hypothetical protein [Rhodococcus wratislaviensis]|uniref:Uncharacterized protein n=1 Tax=Rhodococcus wratislaviensis NBRC 100605 TaxID=1219028 RepID=X0Q9Q2_RHOWR|nr:hypothetical protein [Rhodococcus wratislaviensis]GAF47646.1 hypothetical protein RW1_043_00810 [Rhodococcus wratislaviensis NBRC 100605]
MDDPIWDDKIDDALTAFAVMVAVRAAESGMLDDFLTHPVRTCEAMTTDAGNGLGSRN